MVVLKEYLAERGRQFATVEPEVRQIPPSSLEVTFKFSEGPKVKVGRIQNFKNWSPDMVPDASKSSLGLEYFCTEGDELWKSDGTPDLRRADSDVIDAPDFPSMRAVLEDMHNIAHGYIGGTLGDPHRSFRDPFVFLLHSNVDRLFALWQLQPGHAERLDPGGARRGRGRLLRRRGGRLLLQPRGVDDRAAFGHAGGRAGQARAGLPP